MPKKAKELSALAVTRLKADGRHAVGGVDGLYLRIAGASRGWVLSILVNGRRAYMGLGSTADVRLEEARELARDYRKLVRNGIDPIQQRREAKAAARVERAKATTFRECAEAYIAAHESGWKNDKHAAQWPASLKTYVFPTMGALPVSQVDTAVVLRVLQEIWTTKTETASRVRGRIESVLDWARVAGLREGDNPARWRGHLDKLLPTRSKVRKVVHHAALPYADIPKFMRALRAREGMSARALEFAVLCASRSGEVRGATWSEFDLDRGVWTIPADRMKAEKEHRVPLSANAKAILSSLPRFESDVAKDGYVFPSPSGGEMSNMALTAVLKRMGRSDLTQHGFRSSFRDWAGETTAYPREVIEHALAHQLKDKAEAAYQRGDLLRKRAALMADWGAYCLGAAGEESEARAS